jgi:hypothetical protein
MEKRILMSAICTGLCLFGANPASADAITPAQQQCNEGCVAAFRNSVLTCVNGGFNYPNGVRQADVDNAADSLEAAMMMLCSRPALYQRMENCSTHCIGRPVSCTKGQNRILYCLSNDGAICFGDDC